MKKTYIVPFITIENFEEESALMQFSKIGTDAIGEGDEVTNGEQIGGTTPPPENEEGEGLNAKGFNFHWDFDFE